MLILNLIGSTSGNLTQVPFEVKANTNSNIETNSDNQIIFKQDGIYEVAGSFLAKSTASSGSFGMEMFYNNESYGIQYINTSSAANQQITLPIYQSFIVTKDDSNEFATIDFWPVGSAEIIGGNITVKKIS